MNALTFCATFLFFIGAGLPLWAQDGNSVRDVFPEVRKVQNSEEFQPHVGIMAGVSNPEGSFRTGSEYALEMGYQPMIPFGLGLELNHGIYDGRGTADDLRRTSFLLKGSYNFGGNIAVLKDSYVGLGAGVLLEDSGPSTNYYGGLLPNLGFDIRAFELEKSWVTLGANARYLITSSDNPDIFAVNGVLKYWF